MIPLNSRNSFKNAGAFSMAVNLRCGMSWSSYLQKVDVHGSPEYSGGQAGGSKNNDLKYSMEAITMINTS